MGGRIHFRGDGTHPDFTAWLQDLKQLGSNLLVTGDVPDNVSAIASRALFGYQGRRFRVLGLTDRTTANVASRLPDDTSLEDPTTWTIDQRHGELSVPTCATSVTSEPEVPDESDLTHVCEEVQTAIDFYEEQTGGLDPAELRVGIDSLCPFIQHDRPTLVRALELLTEAVHEVHGMGHYHLRIPDDRPIVEALTPLFDARVELRQEPGMRPEQRWHVPELNETTVWVEL